MSSKILLFFLLCSTVAMQATKGKEDPLKIAVQPVLGLPPEVRELVLFEVARGQSVDNRKKMREKLEDFAFKRRPMQTFNDRLVKQFEVE